MGIPTEVVGSLPRSDSLQQAYVAYDEGKISKDDLVKAQDRAVEDSLRRMAETGELLITDGEQRASSFATYPLTDTLGGTGLAPTLAADGQYFAIFDDGHHRQLPRLTKGPFKYQTYAYENFKKSQSFAKGHAMKTAVIAPSMLYLLYPLNHDIPGYPKGQFLSDLVDECEKDIRGCFDAGAQRVSIDFTEGRLTAKKDPRNPWTNQNLLQEFVGLNNRVLERFTPAERINIGSTRVQEATATLSIQLRCHTIVCCRLFSRSTQDTSSSSWLLRRIRRPCTKKSARRFEGMRME